MEGLRVQHPRGGAGHAGGDEAAAAEWGEVGRDRLIDRGIDR